ncbi:hypothetical protein QBC32DRAFT_269753 [Pseudoneurospora amorphoporcata]|uniref:Killer toxin Kp4 domain-containing protein n=1 Tax=Pseudoneurospora amorphoporcata TaxID=241081 RepID=A0AAN6NNB7_9PEZI|nr:hypothetical protein QBC32DRAFT_269753 [Pseudoneurospora amorphoporcata]
MQSVLAISISLFSLLFPVLGAPTPADHALEARTPGNISPLTFLTRLIFQAIKLTKSRHRNTCEVLTIGINGACVRLPSTYDGHIGTAGPDHGTIFRLFTNGDCTGHGVAILTYPGETNLYSSNGIDAGHQARYIQCRSCRDCLKIWGCLELDDTNAGDELDVSKDMMGNR